MANKPESRKGRDQGSKNSGRSFAERHDKPGKSSLPQRGTDSASGRYNEAVANRRSVSVHAGSPARSSPPLPGDMSARELDPQTRRELRSLPKDLADTVARHLVMAGRLLEDDPGAAYSHAAEARRMARRVGVVREACGFIAYRAERWSEALAEFRAARRMTGSDAYLPVIADCERGLGRPERALSLARSREVAGLHRAARLEMRIVESGARRDLGQYDAAVLALQDPDLRSPISKPHSVRLAYAYADALCDAGRTDEAGEWLARAAAMDDAGDTDAGDRLAAMDVVEMIDTAADGDVGDDGDVGS